MECGASVPFTLTLQTSAGPTDVPFDLPTGSAGPFTAYDSADVYPHYVVVLTRVDGQPHGSAVQQVIWCDRPALQL